MEPRTIIHEELLTEDEEHKDIMQVCATSIRIQTLNSKLDVVGYAELELGHLPTQREREVVKTFYAQGKAATQRTLHGLFKFLKIVSTPAVIMGPGDGKGEG